MRTPGELAASPRPGPRRVRAAHRPAGKHVEQHVAVHPPTAQGEVVDAEDLHHARLRSGNAQVQQRAQTSAPCTPDRSRTRSTGRTRRLPVRGSLHSPAGVQPQGERNAARAHPTTPSSRTGSSRRDRTQPPSPSPSTRAPACASRASRHHRRLRRECLPDRGVIPGLASPNSETADTSGRSICTSNGIRPTRPLIGYR